jgi:hypothetical protein
MFEMSAIFVEIGQCRICAVLWWPFWKWRPVEIFRCQKSIRDFIIYPHEMALKLDNVEKWPPQYRTNSTLSDFNEISSVGRLWCPEFIPDIEKFLAVAISKMAPKIQHFPISSWRPVEIFRCQKSIRDFIIYPHEMALKLDNVEFVRYCGGHCW